MVTGGIIEAEFLGKPDRTKLESKLANIEQYINFKDALRVVKESQRESSSNGTRPSGFLARDLRNYILKALACLDENLKFYTAIGSPLDRFHGIDGFFEYTNEKGENKRVTLDVTQNTSKDNYKSDIIIMSPRGGIDPVEEKEAYGKFVEHYGKAIIQHILTNKDDYVNNYKKAA